MRALRVVILDFDGVVLESNAIKTAVFQEVFAQFRDHQQAMMTYHAQHQAASRYDKFAHLAERLGRSGDKAMIDSLAADFSARIEQRMAVCPWVPGAEAFLAHFSSRVPVYVASMTPEAELNRTISGRGIGRFCRRVYGFPPWNKGRAVDDIVSCHGGSRDGVVLVGDSAGDQRVAAAAGVEFVARDSGLPFDDPQPLSFADMLGVAAFLAPRLESLPRSDKLKDWSANGI